MKRRKKEEQKKIEDKQKKPANKPPTTSFLKTIGLLCTNIDIKDDIVRSKSQVFKKKYHQI